MDKKQEIAIGIALQTQALKACSVHNLVYCGDISDTDDENVARAFSLAIDLVRRHEPYAREFHHNAHELTDLLSHIMSTAPDYCPDCLSPRCEAVQRAGASA